mmetsp:Transcript_35445/g.69509  ORF Transcript_35445/g.69509 Transcript_35445/m.69509 type:complete len:204 (-) Transcript_35445:336-947(-)
MRSDKLFCASVVKLIPVLSCGQGNIATLRYDFILVFLEGLKQWLAGIVCDSPESLCSFVPNHCVLFQILQHLCQSFYSSRVLQLPKYVSDLVAKYSAAVFKTCTQSLDGFFVSEIAQFEHGLIALEQAELLVKKDILQLWDRFFCSFFGVTRGRINRMEMRSCFFCSRQLWVHLSPFYSFDRDFAGIRYFDVRVVAELDQYRI